MIPLEKVTDHSPDKKRKRVLGQEKVITLHCRYIGPDKDRLCTLKLHLFPYSSILTCGLGAQKNRLIEMVLLSTHNVCFS